MSVLSGHGIGDGLLQRFYAIPLVGRPHAAIAAHLIDAPVNFQRVVVRVAKFHGDLAAGAPPAFKIDFSTVFAQAVAGVQNFGEGRNFEGKMVQFSMRGLSIALTD